MSALGQKQTFAVQDGMSAVTPIARTCAVQLGMSALCQKRTSDVPEKISLGGNCGTIDRWQNKLIQLNN